MNILEEQALPETAFIVIENLTGIHNQVYTVHKKDNYGLWFDKELLLTLPDGEFQEGFRLSEDKMCRLFYSADEAIARAVAIGASWQRNCPTVIDPRITLTGEDDELCSDKL